jgi:hypothetical protein
MEEKGLVEIKRTGETYWTWEIKALVSLDEYL